MTILMLGVSQSQQEGKVRTLEILQVLAVFTIASIMALPEVGAQGRKGSGGRGYKGEYQGKYDPQTVTIFKGIVETIEQMPPATGTSYGIHLDLKTDKETVSIQLGPAWFIEKQNMRIEEGDSIEVRGSRIKYEGTATIIAAEVKKGNKVLKLRDQSGFPLWAGVRKRKW